MEKMRKKSTIHGVLPPRGPAQWQYCSWWSRCQSLWLWTRCFRHFSPCWPPPCPPSSLFLYRSSQKFIFILDLGFVTFFSLSHVISGCWPETGVNNRMQLTRQDPMVFPPRGNFKSTSICQTALSSQVCKESANLQIYSRSPCPPLTISAFCKNLFCRSRAIFFDRCWAAGKTTFWVWSQKVNRLNIITWKCSEQKNHLINCSPKTILIFNQLGL